MPVQFEIDHAERFVRVRAYGIVRLSEILDYVDALVLQDAMPYPTLSAADVALRLRRESGRLAPVIALIAARTKQPMIVLESMTRTFLDPDEALRWLDAEPSRSQTVTYHPSLSRLRGRWRGNPRRRGKASVGLSVSFRS